MVFSRDLRGVLPVEIPLAGRFFMHYHNHKHKNPFVWKTPLRLKKKSRNDARR